MCQLRIPWDYLVSKPVFLGLRYVAMTRLLEPIYLLSLFRISTLMQLMAWLCRRLGYYPSIQVCCYEEFFLFCGHLARITIAILFINLYLQKLSCTPLCFCLLHYFVDKYDFYHWLPYLVAALFLIFYFQ